MKKQKINLKKLVKLKIVQIVEPSEEMKNSYLQKSADTLRASKILLKSGLYADSISLSYFSIYNSVMALFFLVGIKSENHNASIFLLGDIFGIENEKIIEAKFQRKDKQYYPNFEVSESEVNEAIRSTEDFNAQILDFINTMNSKDKNNYLKKAENLLLNKK